MNTCRVKNAWESNRVNSDDDIAHWIFFGPCVRWDPEIRKHRWREGVWKVTNVIHVACYFETSPWGKETYLIKIARRKSDNRGRFFSVSYLHPIPECVPCASRIYKIRIRMGYINLTGITLGNKRFAKEKLSLANVYSC